MTERAPLSVKNLDGYGNPELTWERVRDPLASGALREHEAVIGTVRTNGRPHAVRVGALWMDGDLYFTSSPESRKAKNLSSNPNCTIAVALDGIDVSMEGTAIVVEDPQIAQRVATIYREENKWPAEAEGAQITAPYNA